MLVVFCTYSQEQQVGAYFFCLARRFTLLQGIKLKFFQSNLVVVVAKCVMDKRALTGKIPCLLLIHHTTLGESELFSWLTTLCAVWFSNWVCLELWLSREYKVRCGRSLQLCTVTGISHYESRGVMRVSTSRFKHTHTTRPVSPMDFAVNKII